jgi:hypothetical protein
MKKSFSMPWTHEFFADLFIYFSIYRLAQSVLLFYFFFSDDEDPKKYAATAPIVDAPVSMNHPHKRQLWCLSHQKLLPKRLVLVLPNA